MEFIQTATSQKCVQLILLFRLPWAGWWGILWTGKEQGTHRHIIFVSISSSFEQWWNATGWWRYNVLIIPLSLTTSAHLCVCQIPTPTPYSIFLCFLPLPGNAAQGHGIPLNMAFPFHYLLQLEGKLLAPLPARRIGQMMADYPGRHLSQQLPCHWKQTEESAGGRVSSRRHTGALNAQGKGIF